MPSSYCQNRLGYNLLISIIQVIKTIMPEIKKLFHDRIKYYYLWSVGH